MFKPFIQLLRYLLPILYLEIIKLKARCSIAAPCVYRSNLRSLFCFIVLMVMSFAGRTHADQFAGGTGELHDPYQIATVNQLISIASNSDLLDKHFVLINDIDLNPSLPGGRVFIQAIIAPDTNFLDGGFQGVSFTGQFDGNGFSIKNLILSGENYLGLFGKLEEGAKVFNLTMTQARIVSTGIHVGIISGENHGRVHDCHSSGTVSSISSLGGLVGFNFGSVSNCSSSASISGENIVGGLAGENRGSITNCRSSGTVSGRNSVGGLAGLNNNNRINHCVFAAGLQNLKKFAATFWGIPAGRAAQAFTVT